MMVWFRRCKRISGRLCQEVKYLPGNKKLPKEEGRENEEGEAVRTSIS